MASLVGESSSSGTVSISIRSHFATHHIAAAGLLAEKSGDIEAHSGTVSEYRLGEHRAYVVSAIFSSVAALEANINELFLSAVDNLSAAYSDADPMVRELFAEYWPIVERNETLSKYQTALILARRMKFDRGIPPYQPTDHLIKLRNALVHYKPEWDTALVEHKKLEDRLHTCFPHNPFADANDAFFPKRCLGSGCAKWAVRTSIEFVGEFYSRMGIPHPQEDRWRQLAEI
jgi:hypothetical protein